MKSHFIAFIIMASSAACTSSVVRTKTEFPMLYSGGSPKPVFINVNLILESTNSYVYSEFGTPEYSIEDSGTYIINDTTIILNSVNTLYRVKRHKKSLLNREHISQGDSINRQKLFVNQRCSIHTDKIIIWNRNSLVNNGFGFSLYNFRRHSNR